MIKVDGVPGGRSELAAVSIKIVERDAGALIAEMFLEPAGEPAFSGATSSDDRNETRSMRVNHTAALSVARLKTWANTDSRPEI